MRSNIDSSELDRLGQILDHLEKRQPGDISSLDLVQLDNLKIACQRIVDRWDLDDGLRTRAALVYARATELKIVTIMTAASGFASRLCRSCVKGHRVPCATCTCSEQVTVRLPGHVRKGVTS